MRARTRSWFTLLFSFASLTAACEIFLPLDEHASTGDGGPGGPSDGASSIDGSFTTDGQVGGDGSDGGVTTSKDASFDVQRSAYDASGSTSYCGTGSAFDVFCADFDESPDPGDRWITNTGLTLINPGLSAPSAVQAATSTSGQIVKLLTSPSFSLQGASTAALTFAMRVDIVAFTDAPFLVSRFHVGSETITLEWRLNGWNYYHSNGTQLIGGNYNIPVAGWHQYTVVATQTVVTVEVDGAPISAADAITFDGAGASVELGISAVDTMRERGVTIDNVRMTIE